MSWRDDLRFGLSPRRKPVGVFSWVLRRPTTLGLGPADPPVPVSEPPLIVQLLALRDRKGAALTEAEVTAYLEVATSVMMPLSEARDVAKTRGYDDLDPGNLWVEWQAFLASTDDESPANV